MFFLFLLLLLLLLAHLSLHFLVLLLVFVPKNLTVTAFGQYHIWPNLTGRIWPTLFGRICLTEFGQTAFGQIFGMLWGGCWGGGHGGNLESGGGRRSGGQNPEKVGPEGLGPEGRAQNFALFFLSPAGNFILSSLSGGSSRGILAVFEAPGRSNVHVGVLRLSCETPATPKPPGFPTTAREPKSAHGSRSSQIPPKFNEKTHSERQKERIGDGRRKKSAKFWAVRWRGVRRRGVWWRVVQTNNHTTNTNHNNNKQTTTHKNGLAKNGLAKIGLAKIGQITTNVLFWTKNGLAKNGLAQIGLALTHTKHTTHTIEDTQHNIHHTHIILAKTLRTLILVWPNAVTKMTWPNSDFFGQMRP